jgi:hypothetical protein
MALQEFNRSAVVRTFRVERSRQNCVASRLVVSQEGRIKRE